MHIDYDDNNYPRRIQFANGNVTEYVYTATGEKLRAVHYTAVPNIEVGSGETHTLTDAEILFKDSTDYHGSLIMENGVPAQYLFDGGYCKLNDSDGNVSYHYYDRDHLGNIRGVIDEDGTVEQITNYYPFGAPYSDATTTNPTLQRYKYNGKELELMHGLKWYDYGARWYDPLLVSWNRPDPSHKDYYPWSPYVYCGDNPVNRIDPNGLDWYQDELGHLQWNSALKADNWQEILSEESKYIGTTAYAFEHESGIAYFGNENGVLSPYRPFGAEGVVVTGTNLSNTLKAQLFGNSGSIPAGQYSSPNADAISIGIGGSLSLCGIDYGIEAGLIVGNGIISPYVSVYGDIDVSSLYNSYRNMSNLAKMISFNYYGSVMLYNQLSPYENNFNKYSGDGSASTYGVGNIGFVLGQGFNQKGSIVSDMYGITINSSPVVYSKERIKTWIPFSH